MEDAIVKSDYVRASVVSVEFTAVSVRSVFLSVARRAHIIPLADERPAPPEGNFPPLSYFNHTLRGICLSYVRRVRFRFSLNSYRLSGQAWLAI